MAEGKGRRLPWAIGVEGSAWWVSMGCEIEGKFQIKSDFKCEWLGG